MASEPRTKTRDDLADDIIRKIDAYLDGSLSADDASAWARALYKEDWVLDEIIIGGAIDALAFLGPSEHHTQASEIREFREYLTGERDYVVHHRYVRSRAK
jgi:hypothetical protein